MSSERRKFIKQSFATAAGIASTSIPTDLFASSFHQTSRPTYVKATSPKPPKQKESIRFSVIGLNHGHIYEQVKSLQDGGGELVAVYAKEPDLLNEFTKRYPKAKVASSEEEILGDSSIQMVVSAAIPSDRAPLGVRVMKSGKDYMVDKPGITSLEQLAEVKRVQKQTNRIYFIMYSERLGNSASVKAGELTVAGAIGKVVQTIGMGPHRMRPETRPDWFFDPKYFGGILTDIGSHQADQFLYYTGSNEATVVASQIGNINNPQYPKFEDFGDMMVRGNGGTGYIRIDWFTPNGLSTWGDGRLTILGTEGYMELRKYVDIAGRKGGNHLFLVGKKETKYYDCSEVYVPFGSQLVNDVVNRTETAMSQKHCFLATELALKGQAQATRL
ncbi:MAG: Gfo/Idh/MocA family oxidoreductase [Bacteroidetes bacterium]|nr:Gfo/Idh/MocA family oxidoreductase [Bacteroidota bacterium]MDA1122384.1 Gfo/Idh/MocA family oxidoreductase [Bacteroidota bacterium]